MAKERTNPEGKLQVGVCNYLNVAHRDVYYFHVPNQRDGDIIQMSYLKKLGVKAGVADLILVWKRLFTYIGADGNTVTIAYPQMGALELKSPKGYQSDTQKAFQERWVKLGGLYAVCRSMNDVEAALQSWGLKPGCAAPRHLDNTKKQMTQNMYHQIMMDIAADTRKDRENKKNGNQAGTPQGQPADTVGAATGDES